MLGISTDELKRRLPDVKRIAEELYPAQFDFRGANFRCPFPENHKHGDRKYSGKYDRGKGRLFCASQDCLGGEKGVDGFSLIQLMDDCDFPSAVRRLAERYASHLLNETNGKPTPPTSKGSRTNPMKRKPAQTKAKVLAEDVRATLRNDGYQIVAEYEYPEGVRKIRFEHETTRDPAKDKPTKSFLWEHREGDEWYSGQGDVPKGIYVNKPFRERDQVSLVLACEGENKTDVAGKMGYPAVSFKDNWNEKSLGALVGCDVSFWPDNDDQGLKQAKDAAEVLSQNPKVRSVSIITPPGELGESEDIVDAVNRHDWDRNRIDQLIDGANEYQRRKLGIVPLSELRGMKLPKKNPIIENVLHEGDTILMVGRPKTGKSRLLQQATLCLSRGEEFLGQRVEKKRRVLYLDLENRPAGALQRFQQMGKSDPVADANVLIYAPETLSENEFSLDLPNGVELLREQVRKHEPDVLIIDTWRLFLGGKDENKTEVVVNGLKKLSQIREDRPKLAIVLVHHLRKHGNDSTKLRENPGAWVENCSGHHALVSHVDACLGLEREVNKEGDELIVFGGVARSTTAMRLLLEEDDKTLRFSVADPSEGLSHLLTPKELKFWEAAKKKGGAFTFTELLEKDKNKKALSSMLKKAVQMKALTKSVDGTYLVVNEPVQFETAA